MGFIKANVSDETYKAMKQIDSYDKKTQDRIRTVIKDKVNEIYTEAVHRAPFKTGKLKGSIQVEFAEKGTSGLQGRVYTNNPVAHLVEYGTKGGVIKPIKKKALTMGGDGNFFSKAVISGRPGRPFMKPAIDKVRPSLNEAVKGAIKNETK